LEQVNQSSKADDVTQGKSQASNKGDPGSTYEEVDNDGNVKSQTKYGENGKTKYWDDYTHNHYDKNIKQNLKQNLKPHRHIYEYNDKGQPVKPKVPVIPISY